MATLAHFESRPIAALDGIKVVDADTHLSEPHDLWTSRAPAKYRDRVPQVTKTDKGLEWFIDGDKSLGIHYSVSAIHKSGRKAVGLEFMQWSNADVDPGAHDLTARLKAMDAMGVHAQIVYPNVMGFGGQASFKVDAGLREASIQIFNDAMAELQADSGNRCFPMALLPWWDIKAAVAEAERCAKMGLRGINTNPDPQDHGLPDLGTDYWYPLWEACVDLDLPVNFHIGASDESVTWFARGCWPSHGPNAQLAYGSTMLFVGNQRILANILISRFLERFPRLKMVSVESGVAWIPFILEAVDYQMREAGIIGDITPWEIFERQIYACSWFERRDYARDIRRVGVNNVLFETDYPHPTCLYPGPLQYMEEALDEMSREEVGQIFSNNAVRVYGLPI